MTLTEKASFSTKCEIPLGYLTSCLDPEFTKTNKRLGKQYNLKDKRSKWLRDTQRKQIVNYTDLLPTVQNSPNLFCEATLRPFSRVVIFVSYCSCPSTEANTGFGIPGKGAERDTFGYPLLLPLLYCLHAAMPNL